ncbi:4589_t:CDS:2 [Entrophospora sp. SA101]|nr:4589_t:CDS:2 [Entrophospora sp. SA101]
MSCHCSFAWIIKLTYYLVGFTHDCPATIKEIIIIRLKFILMKEVNQPAIITDKAFLEELRELEQMTTTPKEVKAQKTHMITATVINKSRERYKKGEDSSKEYDEIANSITTGSKYEFEVEKFVQDLQKGKNYQLILEEGKAGLNLLTGFTKRRKKHLQFLVEYLKNHPVETLIYEYSNYLNRNKGFDTINLFRLMGAIEGLNHTFPNIKEIKTVYVKEVKSLYNKIYAKEASLPNLNYKVGRESKKYFVSFNPPDTYFDLRVLERVVSQLPPLEAKKEKQELIDK